MIRLLSILFVVLALKPAMAQNAPYVNAAVADSEFYKITSDDMDRLRELKILFGSRSFGQNLRGGLGQLRDMVDPIYDFTGSRYEESTFNSGGDVSVFDPAAPDSFNWIQNWVTASPYTKRIFEQKTLLESPPHHYQDDIDVFMIQYHTNSGSSFPTYREQMDSMRARNPHITFIYVTSAVMGSSLVSNNTASVAFGDSVRRVYKGQVPVYDLGYILSDDGRCGIQYCPEYSVDPADVHPNTAAGQMAMARGFLVLLYKTFIENDPGCSSVLAPSTPENVTGWHLGRYSTRITFDYSVLPDCGVKEYRIRRDGADAGTSKGFGFVDRGLNENTSYVYMVAAVGNNDEVSAWSDPCTVSTFSDVTPPTVILVPEIIVNNTVVLEFSEALDPVSAATAGNYTMDGGVSVSSASVVDSIVTLTTSAMTADVAYTLSIANVTDNSVNANAVAPGTQVAVTYSQKTVSEPLAHWTFDGTADDATGSGNDGQWIGTASYGAGVLGQCLDLDGTSTGPYIRIDQPGPVTLDSMRHLSYGLWAKKTDAATGGRLVHKHVVYTLSASATQASGYVGNLAGALENVNGSTAGMNDTEWHHYFFTYDGDSIYVYVDAVLVGTAAQTGNVRSYPGNDIYVGKDPWGNTFAGQVDDFRMYDWALGQTDIAQLVAMANEYNADSMAVASILADNGDSRTVAQVAVFDTAGRVTELYMQNDLGGSVFTITSAVGQLTELKTLHVYGVENHDHSSAMVTNVDAAIANCTELEVLLLNDNDLTALPVAITALSGFTNLSVGNNLLCDISDTLRGWLDANDPDWESDQSCAAVPVAIPVISPAAGTYDGQVTVTITCATDGATIRYTDDGSDVTGASDAYTAPFSITGTATVTARGFKAGRDSSAAVSAAYTILVDSTEPGIASVAAADSVTVEVVFTEEVNDSDATDASNYTIDGLFVTVAMLGSDNETVTLTVSAMAPDSQYTVQVGSIRDRAVPVNTAAGLSSTFTYVDNSGKGIDETAIHLQLDGNLDDASGNGYSSSWYNGESYGTGISGQAVDCIAGSTYVNIALAGAVNLTDINTMTLCAWGKKNSASSTGMLVFRHALSNLAVTADGVYGYYTSRRAGDYGESVSTAAGTDDTDWHHYAATYDGDSIRVYVDGVYLAATDQSGLLRDDPGRDFYIGADLTNELFDGLVDEARVYDWTLSEAQINQVYQLHAPAPPETVAVPVISPAGGTFTDTVSVAITCATAGATVRYTTDGSTPDTGSTVYTGAISLTDDATVTAVGFKDGAVVSASASQVYTVDIAAPDTVAVPVISPVGGAFTDTVSVTITCATAGATVRYTTDGSIPDTGSTTYTGAIALTDDATVTAIGFKDGAVTSGSASQVYTVDIVGITDMFAGKGGAGVITVSPNPARGAVVISVPAGYAGALEIYDAYGNSIFHSMIVGANNYSPVLQWNGLDMAGYSVESGIYYVRAGNAVTRFMIRN